MTTSFLKTLGTLALLLCLAPLRVMGQQAFDPFPTATDDYWLTAIPQAMRDDYVALGEQYAGREWKAIPDELFAEFRSTGNRINYEAASFGIRRQFACLVMAEIMQAKGRFLPDIVRGLRYFIGQEPWWGLPAHYPKAKPDKAEQVVDLFNAETAGMLAWAIYMLNNQLPTALTDSVRQEIGIRFLQPTLYNQQGWKHNANNWNTWITSNWLTCVMICENDSARRTAALQGVRECLTLFLNGYPDDGGCEEGVSYWDRAAASFFESLWLMQYLPESERLVFNDQQKAKVRAMGAFITTMHISDLRFVNFSDATSRNLPNINILFPYGYYLDDKPMMQFAAYIGKRHDYCHHPSRLFRVSGNYPTLGRELLMLSLLPHYLSTEPQQPHTDSAYLQNSQILVASNDTWLLAAKGGHNGESHNHNDVGNYILYHHNEPVIIDLGRDTYTSLTFSKHRYELMNNRSAYHNVPLINGHEQAEGREHGTASTTSTFGNHEIIPAAQGFTQDGCSVLLTSFAKAYPQEAGVEELDQRVMLNRSTNAVEVDTRLSLAHHDGETSLTLMCLGEPSQVSKNTIALHDGTVLLSFDPKLLVPRWEHVALPDGVMHDQWGDHVFRLHLTLTKKALRKGIVSYRFAEN